MSPNRAAGCPMVSAPEKVSNSKLIYPPSKLVPLRGIGGREGYTYLSSQNIAIMKYFKQVNRSSPSNFLMKAL
jgi:hypothetical protein